jgi:transcriptional regulator
MFAGMFQIGESADMAKGRKDSPSAVDGLSAAMSQDEIAEALHISRQMVGVIERRALDKLRRNPKVRELFEEAKDQWSISEGLPETHDRIVHEMIDREIHSNE